MFCVPFDNKGTCFYKKKITKWSFSVKVERIVPRSEFRAEKFGSLYLCMRNLGTIVPKNVFDNKGTCFYKKKKKNTEQNGPLVLKWNQLFRVPIHQRNRLVLYL